MSGQVETMNYLVCRYGGESSGCCDFGGFLASDVVNDRDFG